MQSPHQLHWTAACCVLRYLKGPPSKWLYYCSSHLDIVRYFDDDWASDPINRHSITSYCTYIGGNLVTGDVKNKMLLYSVLRLSIEP